MNRGALFFNFGRKESLSHRLLWVMYNTTLYLRLVSPILAVLLKFNLPGWIRFLVIAAMPIQNETRVLAARRRKVGESAAGGLKEKGYADISSILKITPDEIREVKEYFLSSNVAYDSQVPIWSSLTPRRVSDLTKLDSISYISFPIDYSLGNIVVGRIASSSALRDISASYLGFKSSLYGINTMLTKRCDVPHGVTNLHRDYDDFLFLTFFVYWTDTTKNNGATYFVPGSHLNHVGTEGIYLEGHAGSVFALDTYGLHAGNKSIQSERLATWIRYGRIPNVAYICDKNYLFSEDLKSASYSSA